VVVLFFSMSSLAQKILAAVRNILGSGKFSQYWYAYETRIVPSRSTRNSPGDNHGLSTRGRLIARRASWKSIQISFE